MKDLFSPATRYNDKMCTVEVYIPKPQLFIDAQKLSKNLRCGYFHRLEDVGELSNRYYIRLFPDVRGK